MCISLTSGWLGELLKKSGYLCCRHPIQPLPRVSHQEIAAPLLASALENPEDIF